MLVWTELPNWQVFTEDAVQRGQATLEGILKRDSHHPSIIAWTIINEFGNWGLPDIDDLLDEEGNEPWWFETGIEWDGGVVYPHGVRERFHMWHLDKIFDSWRDLVDATQWQQYRALKYQIEAMRRRPEIAGYVITELTDVHWECNGLLDMRRNHKVFHAAMSDLNADTVLLPTWDRVAYWAGEEVCLDIAVAHGAGATFDRAEIHWSLGSSETGGRLPVPTVQKEGVEDVGTITFRAPATETPAAQQVNLQLRGPDNRHLATNSVDLAVFPRRDTPAGTRLLWTSDPKLARRLRALGHPLASEPRAADTIVVRKLDTAFVEFMREGGSVLLLADHPDAIEGNWSGIQVQSRAETAWSGDWASSFTWVRRDGPLARLPGGPLIDHSFDRVIPQHVLTGFRPWAFEAQVHAGLFVGWIHKPAALIAEQRYGSGKVVLTTFRLHSAVLGTDPTATTLFDALIELSRLEEKGSA